VKYMMIIKASEDSEAGKMPPTEALAAMAEFNEELHAAGVLVSAEGLAPSSTGARVTVSRSSKTVIDGPFAEAKELVGGFWMLEVASLEEAVSWAQRVPAPPTGEVVLELRKITVAEDFGEAFSTELREAEDTLRAELGHS
jgi:hypothetical protein